MTSVGGKVPEITSSPVSPLTLSRFHIVSKAGLSYRQDEAVLEGVSVIRRGLQVKPGEIGIGAAREEIYFKGSSDKPTRSNVPELRNRFIDLDVRVGGRKDTFNLGGQLCPFVFHR